MKKRNKEILALIWRVIKVTLITIILMIVLYVFAWCTFVLMPHISKVKNPQTPIEYLYAFPRRSYSEETENKYKIDADYYIGGVEDYVGICSREIEDYCYEYKVNLMLGNSMYIHLYESEKDYNEYNSKYTYTIRYDEENEEITLYEGIAYYDSNTEVSNESKNVELLGMTPEEFNEFYEDEDNKSDYPIVDQIVRTMIDVVDEDKIVDEKRKQLEKEEGWDWSRE